MSTAVMTFSSLSEDVRRYCEKPEDDQLVAEIPRLITLTETELAADLKVLGNEIVVQSTLTLGDAVIEKPSYWRNTVSFTVRTPTEGWKPVHRRTLEYLRNFTPLGSERGVPRFYAEYNINNFLLAPAPSGNYDFELVYNARLDPLSAENETNWFTANAPQLLLYGCMKHAQLFLKNFAVADQWGAKYAAGLAAMQTEDARRATDRGTNEG